MMIVAMSAALCARRRNRTVTNALALAACLFSLPASALEPPQETDEAPKSRERTRTLDFSNLGAALPSSAAPLAGTYRLESPSGLPTRRVIVEEGDHAGWAFVGRAPESHGRTFFKLDPAGRPGRFAGTLEAGLDPCLLEGGRIERALVTESSLEIHVTIPFDVRFHRAARPGCRDRLDYTLIPAGAGLRIKLRERSSIPTLSAALDEQSESVSVSIDPDVPSVAAGTQVAVIDTLHDVNGVSWCLVKARATDDERRAGDAQESGPEERSGWVRASQVVGRVVFTLVRGG